MSEPTGTVPVIRAGVLVLSDKGSRGERTDTSGPALVAFLTEHDVAVTDPVVIPDDEEMIRERLSAWCDQGTYDLILTCGGTGISPRDVTPEATSAILDFELPGFAEQMRRISQAKTPHAMISRAVAGVRRRTLVINLPGSPRAALENIEAVWPAVPHAVAKLLGDMTDCGESPGP